MRALLLAALALAGCDQHIVANLALRHGQPGPLSVQLTLCATPCGPSCTDCSDCPDPQVLSIDEQPMTIALRTRDDRQFAVKILGDNTCGVAIEIDIADGEPLPFDIGAAFSCSPSKVVVNDTSAGVNTTVAEQPGCRGQ